MMHDPPLIVVSSAAELEACVERLERSGAAVRRSWELRAAPVRPNLVCAGGIETPGDAEAALLAVIGGAGIVAVLPHDAALAASFFDDLLRFGQVDVVDGSAQAPLEKLDEEQRRLLDLLGEGFTVTAASRRVFVSTRTAHRRLAAARAALGVRSNAEAVAFTSSGAARNT